MFEKPATQGSLLVFIMFLMIFGFIVIAALIAAKVK